MAASTPWSVGRPVGWSRPGPRRSRPGRRGWPAGGGPTKEYRLQRSPRSTDSSRKPGPVVDQAGEGRHRRHEVGQQLPPDRYDGVVPGQGPELLTTSVGSPKSRIEARALAGVAGAPALLLDHEEQGVAVAVVGGPAHVLPVAGRLALAPVLLAGTAPEPGPARLERLGQRLRRSSRPSSAPRRCPPPGRWRARGRRRCRRRPPAAQGRRPAGSRWGSPGHPTDGPRASPRHLPGLEVETGAALLETGGGHGVDVALEVVAARPLILALANPEPEIRPGARARGEARRGDRDRPFRLSEPGQQRAVFSVHLPRRARRRRDDDQRARWSSRRCARSPSSRRPSSRTSSRWPTASRTSRSVPITSSRGRSIRGSSRKIAPAVAKAAMDSGVATRPIADFDAYRERLQPVRLPVRLRHEAGVRGGEAGAARIVYAEGEEERVLRAAQVVRRRRHRAPDADRPARRHRHAASSGSGCG